ncbi:thioesterase family protein [Pseudorhodobacter sp.]|uniref:thioesterase family protein n=1 Tax=Pseudorhodobacter sp. TaxID=1934400 RepID=UPI002AFF4ADE|nr:thioesterase family protein [Pseudorhodobacter sp.]
MPRFDAWRDAGAATYRGQVEQAWIDRNDHMNVRAYDAVFEAAETTFFENLGITRAYALEQRKGFFRLEKHLRYQAELRLGTPIVVTSYIVMTDLKRVQLFHQLWNAQSGQRSATLDCIAIYVDLETRQTGAMVRQDLVAAWQEMAQAHAALPVPPGIGRRVTGQRQPD